MESLFLVASAALCASGDGSGKYSDGDVGFWMSYMEECPVTESDKYKQFYNSLKEKGITIFPGVVRDDDGTTYDLASRDTIASLFQNRGVSSVQIADQGVDLGGVEGLNAQWALFERSMSLFSDYLKANAIDSGYALMPEYVVGGTINVIQCYILDSDGEDAFSFLLNSHQKLFTDAQQKIDEEGLESRDELVGKGSDVIIIALQHQLEALSKE